MGLQGHGSLNPTSEDPATKAEEVPPSAKLRNDTKAARREATVHTTTQVTMPKPFEERPVSTKPAAYYTTDAFPGVRLRQPPNKADRLEVSLRICALVEWDVD